MSEIKRAPLTEQTRRNLDQTREGHEFAEEIKDKILNYYFQWVEAGRPDHVISRKEAQQILGCRTDDDLKLLLRRAYKYDSFRNLLESLGLPSKKQRTELPVFNQKGIISWFDNFYLENGKRVPTRQDIEEAISQGELPPANEFQKIMGAGVREYRRGYLAQIQTGRHTPQRL